MFQGFWTQLPRPIVALSPMDGVTDQTYRYVQKKYGKPDLIVTEFTSAEGLSRNAIKLLDDFLYDDTQRPVVAQIFGNEPASFRITALMACYLGFDGIDINMGCPVKNVSQHGSGAALIRTPKLAQEIIRQTKAGVQDWVDGKTLDDCPSLKNNTKKLVLERFEQLPENYKERKAIPVSVKTRVGFDVPVIEEWIPNLLEMEPAAISLHGRTLKQLYSGEANWDEIAKAVEIAHQTPTLLLGNGDLNDIEQVKNRVAQTGVDGVLIGRATYGNPWILREITAWRDGEPFTPPKPEDVLQLALEHCRAYEHNNPERDFMPMRKNLAWYVRGFPFASEYRTRLVLANSSAEVETILLELASKNNIPFPLAA